MPTSIGLFDPELKYDALFDDTNVDLGWFDRELVDSTKLGIVELDSAASIGSSANYIRDGIIILQGIGQFGTDAIIVTSSVSSQPILSIFESCVFYSSVIN